MKTHVSPLAARFKKYVGAYLKKMRPTRSAELSDLWIAKIQGFIYAMIGAQSCFLAAIVSSTEHYSMKQEEVHAGKRNKSLWKTAQIEKLSLYLLKDMTPFLLHYLAYVRKLWFSKDASQAGETSASARSSATVPRSGSSIAGRVYRQRLIIQDTTDIIKPSAKAMEWLNRVRDGSKSSKYKNISWNGYLAEGCILYAKNQIVPLLFTFIPEKNKEEGADGEARVDTGEIVDVTKKSKRKPQKEAPLDYKAGMMQNLEALSGSHLLENTYHPLDRGYETSGIIRHYEERGLQYIIRAVRTHGVAERDYFESAIKTCSAQMERDHLFEPLEEHKKVMDFVVHPDYPWFRIGWQKVYRKWENYLKDPTDIIATTLVVVEIKDKKVSGIREDLHAGDASGPAERDMFLWTNIPMGNMDDAIVIFLCYLKRWKIETVFHFLKQTFSLEKMRIISLEKMKNLCTLLMIAANYLYETFAESTSAKELSGSLALEDAMEIWDTPTVPRDTPMGDGKEPPDSGAGIEKEIPPGFRNDTMTVRVLHYYPQYCRQMGLTENISSFAKFIKYEIGDTIIVYAPFPKTIFPKKKPQSSA